ncbi:MAG: hypothetical protein H8E73_04265 [Planctomycetes bacterium]|nr:hypothetical protein [Planctomycetota bacterium]
MPIRILVYGETATEWSIRLGRLAGIEFKINITSSLLLILIFSSTLCLTSMHSTLLATLVICAAFAYVPVHEVGRSLIAGRLGKETESITLLPLR